MRHGYKSSLLGIKYEKGSDNHWKILWHCKTTGTVLEELRLGATDVPEV